MDFYTCCYIFTVRYWF